jgi:hypothetical protein
LNNFYFYFYFIVCNKIKMSSYEAEQKLNQLISNETDPNLSTIDVLASLKAISFFETKIATEEREGTLQASSKIAKAELKWLNLAMDQLSQNPALSNRFGNTMSGAMALSGLLKAHHSKQVTEKIFNDILVTRPQTDPNQTVAHINQGGPAGQAIGGQQVQAENV